MNPFSLPSTGQTADWLLYLVALLAIGISIGIVVIWMYVVRPKKGKRRIKHRKRHHRQHNPTLAETGGLPPVRDPNQPPAGL
jgi:LPXTG-motif cell wall-anchored protein